MPSAHGSRLCDRQKKKIEVVQTVGHARQPALAKPCRMWRFVGLTVRALVVDADNEGGNCRVELRKRQRRGARRFPLYQTPGQLGQKLGVDRAEEAFDLATSLRPADSRMDKFDPQRRRDLFEMDAREVASVIDIEHVWNAAHRPRRILLAPDRLS